MFIAPFHSINSINSFNCSCTLQWPPIDRKALRVLPTGPLGSGTIQPSVRCREEIPGPDLINRVQNIHQAGAWLNVRAQKWWPEIGMKRGRMWSQIGEDLSHIHGPEVISRKPNSNHELIKFHNLS